MLELELELELEHLLILPSTEKRLILDVCCLLKIAKNEEVNVAKAHLFEIVSMLSKMCR